jgi:two-component system cell cycle response regulator
MSTRILVVDDEQANRDLLEAVLMQDGHTVLLAADGDEALRLIEEQPPDLVLLDLMMPKLNGFEVCQRLEQQPATSHIPVLIVTALGQPVSKEAALGSGADDFLVKPVDVEDLRTRVKAILKVSEIHDDLLRTLNYLQEIDTLRYQQRAHAVAQVAIDIPENPASFNPQATVLVVDDDSGSLGLLRSILTDHGYRVVGAASGPEALQVIRQQTVDAMVVDVVMPDMSGLDLLERIRLQYADLPVIMLTGNSPTLYELPAFRSGASDFLTKGTDPILVVLSVHRAVRHRRELERVQSENQQLRLEVARLRSQAGSFAYA